MREAEVAAFMTRKIAALQQLGRLLGIDRTTPDAAELARRRAMTSDGQVYAALAIVTDPRFEPWRRWACALGLEYLAPGWRAHLPPDLLGPTLERNGPEARQWRTAVLARDGWTCQACGATEGLQAHHLVAWADAPELRVVVDNGQTLCGACHRAAHAGRPRPLQGLR